MSMPPIASSTPSSMSTDSAPPSDNGGSLSAPLVQVENLHVAFRIDRKQSMPAVRGVSFDIHAHETLALVGESGSGKSVSALAIMGLLPPETAIIGAGRILFEGQDLLQSSPEEWRALRGRSMAMVFQDPMASLNPVMRVGRQIEEVLQLHQGLEPEAARSRSIALLDEVGIQDAGLKVDAYPHQLSGGQQQRVMIAMALACEPKMLIADEPTTALDVTIQRQIMELLQRLQEKHRMAILFITHDLELVREIAHRVVVMRHGQIRETGKVEAVFNQPQDPYTRALLACRPPAQGRPARLPVIEDFMRRSSQAAEVAAYPEASLPSPTNRTAHALSTGASPAHTASTASTGGRESQKPLLRVARLNTVFHERGLFKNRSHHVVKDVSFELYKGKTLGIVGESGSGKTTLGMTVLRMIPAESGEVWFGGRNTLALSAEAFKPLKRRMQLIFQNPLASLNPRFTIADVLMEPLNLHQIGSGPTDRMQRVRQLLDRVGLPASALNKYPHEFSGGQCQRIAIARCLTLEPELLVCDESVSALDVSVQAQVLNLLKDLQEQLSLTYLFISHDLGVIRYLCDEVLVMHQGRVVEQGPVDMLFVAPQHDYTRTLLAAVPAQQVSLCC